MCSVIEINKEKPLVITHKDNNEEAMSESSFVHTLFLAWPNNCISDFPFPLFVK